MLAKKNRFAVLIFGIAFVANDAIVGAADVPIRVTLRLSVSQVSIGDKVVLEESIPGKLDIKVAGIWHDVLRVGRYSRNTGSLVNIDHKSFLTTNPTFAFSGLPRSKTYLHSTPLKPDDSGNKAVKFIFSPTRLGIFYVTASWMQDSEKEEWLASNPVILIVNPPNDKARKIEADWLREWPDGP